ncbi:phosphodiester glycosidase family protein [uncultured Bacteroides sp.]|uniref:phosphodiester glycosidase family protein n=1 Tax=uncultured Bacteroides sp. TaxID=162156 RepID=UPI002AA71F92|nr:phosphodiester glycosidase family protein [uncultured Bacteroides sp.]
MKKIYYLFLLVIPCLSMACDNKDTSIPEWPWNDTPEEESTEANPDIVKLGWTNVDADYGDLPTYMDVYKSPEMLAEKTAVAYIVVADMSQATFNVWGDVSYSDAAQGYGSATVKTPSEIYSEENLPVIINGGLFFWDNSSVESGFYYSQSLAIRNSELLSPNQNYYSEDWVTLWYPTIGAFCQMEDGSFKTTWTYYTSGGVNYSYPAPADNSISKDPLDVPSATFPEGASELKAKTAIGGASVLIHDGVIKNTYAQEMLDVSADSDQPRSAIGTTGDNKMIIFACEGREATVGSVGLTTANVAEVLKALGCVEALNLDGGGSSCLLVNGKETIKPCNDGNAERKILTAVTLK